jgi:hypothetical protein
MDNDRTLRRLTSLEQSASTARVLNLVGTHRKNAGSTEIAQAPFFKNRMLDRTIILKHRLRPHEQVAMSSPKPTVTKVLIPIDTSDLRAGAHSFFVGQKNFDQLIVEVFGDDLKPGSRDRRVLELLDGLPSLDPFLLRECLRRNDFEPARAYFNISDADIARMHEFVRQEVMALVSLSSGDAQGAYSHSSRLVEKLLSNAPDSGFEPLKDTLKLTDQEYSDGVFSWRGFLYYKWVLRDMEGPVKRVVDEILKIQPRGPKNPEASGYIAEARARLKAAIAEASASVGTMLDVYNKAYAALTEEGKPNAFRDFLLTAPGMFANLGEKLGALQHTISFWRYRFPEGQARLVTPDELMDLFLDFEDSYAFS